MTNLRTSTNTLQPLSDVQVVPGSPAAGDGGHERGGSYAVHPGAQDLPTWHDHLQPHPAPCLRHLHSTHWTGICLRGACVWFRLVAEVVVLQWGDRYIDSAYTFYAWMPASFFSIWRVCIDFLMTFLMLLDLGQYFVFHFFVLIFVYLINHHFQISSTHGCSPARCLMFWRMTLITTW